MSVFAGIEKVDPIERLKQHKITKMLWQQLCEKGIRKGDKGRINAYLVADLYEQAESLKAEYQGGFKVTIFEQDESSKYLIEIITPVCNLSNEALEELADMLMISAVDTKTQFDGFEIDMNEVKKLKPPWWRIW